jgi:poly(3-hydroxybutyrate) depolymerase
MLTSSYRCLFIGVVFALPVSLFAASDGIRKDSLEVLGKRHQYFVFVPDTVASGPAPMLILLHGYGRDGRSLVDPWKNLAAREGLILVAPNAVNPIGWQNPIDGPEVLIGIADAVKKQYPVDSSRVYLFGHSAGAVFALLMPLWEPRYFAAVSVHAGAIPRGSEALAEDAARAVRRKTPIQIQAGISDRFIPMEFVRSTRTLLTANGFTVELREIPRHDHNYYSTSKEINEEAWRFLKDRRMESK